MINWLLGRGRVPVLTLIAALSVFFAFHAARLGVERNNESLQTEDAVQLRIYEEFKRTFGVDEDLLLTVTHPRLLEPAGLTLVDEVTREVAAIDGVRDVLSLTTAKVLVPGPGGAEEAPLVAPPLDAADVAERAARSLDDNPDFTGTLVSADRRTAGLLVELEDRPGDTGYRGAVIDRLRQIIERKSTGGAELHLTGVSVQKNDVTAFIQRDQRLLMPLAVGMLGVLLAFFFRRLLGVVLPLAVNGLTVLWTLGAYRLAGHELNAITSLLPPLLLVISLAVSVHVFQRWLAGFPEIRDPVGRVKAALRSLSLPAFFCALTTVQGFASLAANDMPAVRQFGIFAALGAGLSFLFGTTLIPIALSYVRRPPAAREVTPHPWMMGMLRAASRISTRRPVVVLVAFALVTGAAALGLPSLRSNTDLVRFLKRDAQLHRDTLFIDDHLGGAFALEFVLARADGGSLASLDAVHRLAAFEQAARKHRLVTATTSLLAVLRQIQRAESGTGRLDLPQDEEQTAYAFDLLEAAPDQRLLRRMVSSDFSRARISVRLRAVGSYESAPLIAALLSEGARIFGSAYRLVPTGALYQVVHDSDRLVREQVQSFGLALLLVVLAIGALFRSARFTFVALIPNVAPILWTFGLMGYAGIDLSTGTAMIASAVLGLTVDDTIHYLAHYRRAYRGDCVAAIRQATETVGAPVTITSVTLIFGFWIGSFGSFQPTIHFSLLTGLTFITGVACDLFVVPAALVLIDRRRGLWSAAHSAAPDRS